ncbi:hypothetical protein AU252_21200 [Pseudarthrobacter sulfonivorans]|uniref:Uncharacterized protein n=2 Tax=Pseudarthrobacter sulfonivorans TaxID=121292 RepID=A0A0U3R2K1_9MICC|nr:hypothetical protein AU252_21200 [Pseudarthrobacter sulfonivorans]
MPFGRMRARRLHRLALNSLASGDMQRAGLLAEQALRRLPTNDPTLGHVIERVTMILTLASVADASRHLREAADWLTEAATLLEDFPNSAIRDTWLAEVLTRLGDSLRQAGHHGEALEALRHACALAEQNGTEPLRTAGAHNALGILAKTTGDYPRAVHHYAQARLLIETTLGTDAPELASLHHNLAGLLHIQGLYLKAEPEIRTALELRRGGRLPDRAGIAADLSVLGAVLAGQGRFEEAKQSLETALGMWESLYGPQHYEVAVQLHNLASIHQEAGDLDAANVYFVRALDIKERTLGGSHVEIGEVLCNFASLRCEQGFTAEGLMLYAKALAIFEACFGPDHPKTQMCAGRRSRAAMAISK